jgi:hypothetical protein
MSLDTFSTIQQRVNYLIGDTSATTQAIINSHINASVNDITNAYPFSWDITKTTGAITGSAPEYSFNLAADYNPKWHLMDARIVGTNTGDDHIFEEIVINDRDQYSPGTYKYWITYNTSSQVYVFNTKESSGTVTYYYYFKPATLSAAGDFTVIPDTEALCYLAASKNWLTDERNQALTELYKQEASARIQSMWQTDNSFGAVPVESTVVDWNPWLSTR